MSPAHRPSFRGLADPRSLATLMTLMVLASLLDCLSTWYVTPDLQQEGNPLYRMIGGGWWTVIAIKMGMSLTAGLLLLRSIPILRRLYPEHASNPHDLMRGMRREVTWTASCLLRWLVHWWGSLSGITLSLVVIVTGLAAAISNTFGIVQHHGHLIAFYTACAILILALRSAVLWTDFLFRGAASRSAPTPGS